MTLEEVNEVLDKVEEIIHNDSILDMIASDEPTLDRSVTAFNSLVDKCVEKENLPDPSGAGPCTLE